MTILAVLGFTILALLGFIAILFEKHSTDSALLKNNDVVGQIEKNKGLIEAEKQALKEKEANETNDSILDDLNRRK